jgi:hypothetical protein
MVVEVQALSERAPSKASPRVIALLPAAAPPPQVHPGIELVRVRSGYEAAAEMLAAPASALVADLARITPAHLPLLDLARKLGLPVVAFGTVMAELTGDHLCALRLVSPPAVGRVLQEVLDIPEGEPEPAPSQEEPAKGPPARAVPASLQARDRAATETLTQAELDALLGDVS